MLPTGKEDWLEFWFRNHLLAPFPELYARREETEDGGRRLGYLSLPDLIRSKETEWDDDWSDVRLLEEILDGRNLARARVGAGRIQALSQLRSRRGFERAEAAGLFAASADLLEAIQQAAHPVTCAYLPPFAPSARIAPARVGCGKRASASRSQFRPTSRCGRGGATRLSTRVQNCRPS